MKAFLHHTLIAVLVILLNQFANAQDVTGKPANELAKKPVAKSTAPASPAKNWSGLTESQKIALAPLESVWSNISPVKKQKWLDISVGYHLLSPEGQSTLHFRMKEWASLTKKQREQARQNFAQAKKLSAEDKQNKWLAYQALSPEEKLKLAKDNQTNKVAGAAPALKPSTSLVTAPTAIAAKPGTDRPKALLNTPQNPR
ncbi:MAG TPA: DUF3106 domain-containing protein [Burkholderiaceae bacterium]|nr:DUF3106 domain-containing protein [Burkholderiaceae bacterium]